MGSAHDSYPGGGWYPDPTGRGTYRFWSGDSWTSWISDGTTVAADLRPVRRTLDRDDLAHLAFVETVFVPEARAEGIVTAPVEERLTALRQRLEAEARHATVPATVTHAGAPAPQARVPLSKPAAAEPAPEVPAVVPALRPAPAPAARTRKPSAMARLYASTRQALATDLAANGLAYLGVLLVFIGSFGLVVFAFADVARSLRPVAEVVIATVPFATGALLRRRGAVVAGRALEVCGGLLLPLVLLTSFLDGFGVPPDLTGVPLVVALTLTGTAVAAGYAVWSLRHPESGLRFVVAPAIWVTVAMASLGVGRAIPAGREVSVPVAEQMVVVAAALALTLLVAVLKPAWTLSAPTLTSGIVGWAVIGLLSVLAWAAADWPVVPVALSGVLLLATLELLRVRLGPAVVGVLEPLWVTVVGLALVPGLGLGEAGAVTAAVLVLVLERAAAEKAPVWAVALPAALGAVALSCSYAEPWWAVGTFALVTAWALARRLHPYAVPGAARALDVAAAVLPYGAVAAVALATDVAVATAVGAVVVLAATVPATRPVLHRDERDLALWRAWWWAAALAVALVAVPGSVLAVTTTQRWWMVGALVVLLVSLVRGPVPWVWRVWALTSVAAWTWWSAALLLGVPDVLRGTVLGAIGLALVAAAHTLAARLQPVERLSTGAAGHALAVVALVTGGTGWGLTVVLGLATAGFAVSAGFDAVGRSPVVDGLTRVVGVPGRFVMPALAAVGLPVTLMTALDTSGVLDFTDHWMVVVPALTALAYAAASRFLSEAPLRLTAVWAGFALAVVAAAAAEGPLPSAAACAAVILTVVVVRRADRAAAMTWTAWVALAPLAWSLAAAGSDWFARLDPAEAWSLVTVTVGGAMVLLGTGIDVTSRGWGVRLLPVRPVLLPVVAVGAAEVVTSQVLSLGVVGDLGGWLNVAGACVVLVAAGLTRVGSLSGGAVVLGWLGVLRLATDELQAHPWTAVAVTAALLALAEVLHRALPDRVVWSRWDLPVLVAAGPVAVTALWAAADGGAFSGTYFSIGLLCAVVAGRLHRTVAAAAPLGIVGTLLMFSGATNAGSGWVALLLLAYAVACTAAAVVVSGPWKTALQVGGAALALGSWLTALDWFGWSDQTTLDATVAGAAAVALVGAGVAASRRLHPSWIWAWGGTATLVTATAAAVLQLADGVAPSWYAVAGLAGVATATAVAAGPLTASWLRDLAVVLGLGAVLTALEVAEASPSVCVAVLATTSVVLGLVELTAFCSPAHPVVRRVVLETGLAAALLAVAYSLLDLPDRDLLVASLAVAALQAASSGVALRSVALQSAAPVLACGSWLVFASEALDANPQWFAVPVGLALLAVAGLWRRDRRTRGEPAATTDVALVELVGIAFLVGSSFVQTFTISVAYAALAAAIGLLVAGWGLVTRVRRRLVAGILVAVVGVVLLVMVPLVRLLPAWQGAWLWILVVVVGLLALGAASLLESGRTMVRKGRIRFVDLTQGWE